MDLGTDAVVAARFAAEHGLARSFVRSVEHKPDGVVQRLSDARNVHKLLKYNMQELIDHGYTPTELVASNVPWSALQKRYGAEALINMGYTWSHMRNSGISASQACAIGMERLGIGADELMELHPSIQDLAGMRMPLDKLLQHGFTTEKLLALGLTSANMRDFSTSLVHWHNCYRFDSATWNRLGFGDAEAVKRLGWCATEMHTVGMFRSQPASAASRAGSGGGWQF